MKFKKGDIVQYIQPEALIKQYYGMRDGDIFVVKSTTTPDQDLFLGYLNKKGTVGYYNSRYFKKVNKYNTKLGKILYARKRH